MKNAMNIFLGAVIRAIIFGTAIAMCLTSLRFMFGYEMSWAIFRTLVWVWFIIVFIIRLIVLVNMNGSSRHRW